MALHEDDFLKHKCSFLWNETLWNWWFLELYARTRQDPNLAIIIFLGKIENVCRNKWENGNECLPHSSNLSGSVLLLSALFSHWQSKSSLAILKTFSQEYIWSWGLLALFPNWTAYWKVLENMNFWDTKAVFVLF